ncbi:MAG: hypothetical protein GY909_16285 [Oligoflexia bacterium]|nr:hypothetical protein [Oligoflexia bacterium]
MSSFILKNKRFIVISICLFLQIVNIVGSAFGLFENVRAYEDLAELNKASFNYTEIFFITFYRVLMPVYILILVTYLKEMKYDFKKISHLLFIIFTVILSILNIVFYDFGLGILLAFKKVLIYDPDNLIKLYAPIFAIFNSFLFDFVNPILIGAIELLRASTLLFIFKEMGAATWYLRIGILLIIYEIYGVLSSILEFLEYRFFWDVDASILDYTLFFLEVWITIFLTYKFVLFFKNKWRLYENY